MTNTTCGTTDIGANKWLLHVKEDPKTGDGILEFPPELLSRVGWAEGDVLVWTDLGDGTWSLTKKGEEVG